LPLWAITTKWASELKELLASLGLFFLLAAENVKAVHLYPEWQQLPRSQPQWEYVRTQNHKCLKHSYEIPVSGVSPSQSPLYLYPTSFIK